MIVLHEIHYTGKAFRGAVVLPTHDGPLKFDCHVEGPMTLDPSQVKRALLGHAVRQRTR
ncbi:hypothetical protein Q4555_10780 [Octadecabacter sp. 1_MG-2023]|uniref:hypothetical protein n=1 Tax=unclassified Octadecabacter TaxID=196158 RepID=UPI001C08FD16|nr:MULTISPECIES: hypothetical protein [unclassified Octadecabacter]MBU2992085.1 hypothetical protein [Octadecabacter sp. B2R22]MDO6735158.1 hypothetical protein [Octadecabacter sp. 1_MG-2023]